ncbi:MAG: hypothetical protein O7G30_14270, partial [Proteobacteria bacterium]|nr:hypothetical protein [Pseudomonadota bacterium]
MSRLAPLDRVLVLILVPLWVVCFGLAVRTQIRGGGLPFVGLSVENSESYPVLTGEFSANYPSDPLAEAGLRAGDRLVRVGEADLLGVGTLGLIARALDESGRLRVPVLFERAGEQSETSLTLLPLSVFRPGLPASLAFAASALFLILRGRPTPTVRAYFYFAMCWAFWTCAFLGGWYEALAALATIATAACLLFPLALHFLFRFPDDRAPEGRWHRIWPWFFAVPLGLSVLLQLTGWVRIGEMGFIVTFALGAVAMLAVATSKYRRADRVARRQMKWVLFGIYCAALPPTVGVVLSVLDPRFQGLFLPTLWALPLLPLSLLISVLRFNLIDIDRILSATASYNILAVVLGGGALIVVPRIAEALSGVAGVDPGIGQVVLSLLLAAAVVPAHRRLRPQIDRVFFKERYVLDQGIAELLPTLSACTDTQELTERAGAGLHRLLQPEACVVYAGVEQSYAPVFVEGRAVPPAFAAGSPLIVSLQDRRTPLALSDAGRRPDEAPLGPFDRAALETLGAEVVVPVRQGDALAAFVCLGPKRSGDVYTPTDLSHLAAVAETVSQRLQRFDQDEV